MSEASSKRPASTTRAAGLFGKRRDFLINKRYQLRAGFLTAAVVLVLLVLLNLTVYTTATSNADKILADAPELAPMVRAQERVELFLIVLISLIYLAGVFLVTILETHRTAGAAHSLAKRMAEIRSGRYKSRVSLRKGDNLRELEDAFNEMSSSLEERSWRDIEILTELAKEADRVDAALALRLRELAESKRSLVR
jgi:signal transduction histidine kinase